MSAPPISAAARTPAHRGVLRRYVTADFRALGPREFTCNAGSGDLLSDGIALDLLGGDLSRLQGGPLLWYHGFDVKIPDPVIGTVKEMRATKTELPARCEFLPHGVDAFVDTLCTKLKAGAPYQVSLTFNILESRPIPGGVRATKWEGLELSLCAVGVDPSAIITGRARRGRSGVKAMQAAVSQCERALDEHKAFSRHHAELADATQRLDEHRSRFGTALRALHAAIQAGDAESAADCHGRCMRALAGLSREHKAIGNAHEFAGDTHDAMQRCMRAIGEALGHDPANPTEELGAQVSAGQSSRAERMRTLEQIERQRRKDELEALTRAID
jgi:hypothetical protein